MQFNNGYFDLPPGKIANVVICLEMFECPNLKTEDESTYCASECTLQKINQPDPDWYLTLFRRIGEPYLWFSRLTISKEDLISAIHNPAVEIYSVRYKGKDEGILELDFRKPGECELAYFGLTDALIGKGVGRWLMNQALKMAWSHPIKRLWVHTCNDDHPSAVSFYIRSGFRPFKRQIEIADDPRLIGLMPGSAAPQIPAI